MEEGEFQRISNSQLFTGAFDVTSARERWVTVMNGIQFIPELSYVASPGCIQALNQK